MNEQKNNGRGVFYGVIGIATLVVAIIGATFAYFTATASNNNVITGDMATINFGLVVDKVTEIDEEKGGLIPMSNNMVHAAVTNSTPCQDNNNNAVCQIYEVTVSNTGTASLFLDGYISLSGGSGNPTDVAAKEDALQLVDGDATFTVANSTSMRWAQVFKTGDNSYTTVGHTTTGIGMSTVANITKGITTDWDSIDAADAAGRDSWNVKNITKSFSDVTAKGMRQGTEYDVINKNYIRLSDHTPGASYDRNNDISSALVFNQYLDAKSDAVTTDEAKLYFVVWLTETGYDQTADKGGPGAFESTDTNENEKIDADESGIDFFSGEVTFNSAQGSEVTATFSGFASVPSDALTS